MGWTEFKEFASGVLEKARGMLVEDGQHGNMLFAVHRNGAMAIIGLEVAEGVQVGSVVQKVVAQVSCWAFVFVGEGWRVSYPKDEVALAEHIRPRDHPARVEVLQVMAIHPHGRAAWMVPFAKEEGRVVFGRQEYLEGKEQIRGLIAEALEHCGPRKEDKGNGHGGFR